MSASRTSAAMSARRSMAVAAVVLVSACSATASPAVTEPASSPSAPSSAGTMTLMIAGQEYVSEAEAATNTCRSAGTDGWAFLYTAAAPFLHVELKVYPGLLDGSVDDDLYMTIEVGDSAYQINPTGRREEAAGSIASARADAHSVEVTGTAEGRAEIAGRSADFSLSLTCPG